jgi:hypothetical protein
MKKALLIAAVALAFGYAHADEVRMDFTGKDKSTDTKTKTDVKDRAEKILAPELQLQTTATKGQTQSNLKRSAAPQASTSLDQLISGNHSSVKNAVGSQSQVGQTCNAGDLNGMANPVKHHIVAAGNVCFSEFPEDMRKKIVEPLATRLDNYFNRDISQVTDKEEQIRGFKDDIQFMANIMGITVDEAANKYVALANVSHANARGETIEDDCIFDSQVNALIRQAANRLIN